MQGNLVCSSNYNEDFGKLNKRTWSIWYNCGWVSTWSNGLN